VHQLVNKDFDNIKIHGTSVKITLLHVSTFFHTIVMISIKIIKDTRYMY